MLAGVNGLVLVEPKDLGAALNAGMPRCEVNEKIIDAIETERAPLEDPRPLFDDDPTRAHRGGTGGIVTAQSKIFFQSILTGRSL